MRKKKRGQVSIEYMGLVGITSIIVLFLLIISNYYSRGIENSINTNQIDGIAKEIVDTAESMYYYGEPSKTTLRIYIPDKIQVINITTDQIILTVTTPSGTANLAYLSDVPLGGEVLSTEGFHDVEIEARGGLVWINGT